MNEINFSIYLSNTKFKGEVESAIGPEIIEKTGLNEEQFIDILEGLLNNKLNIISTKYDYDKQSNLVNCRLRFYEGRKQKIDVPVPEEESLDELYDRTNELLIKNKAPDNLKRNLHPTFYGDKLLNRIWRVIEKWDKITYSELTHEVGSDSGMVNATILLLKNYVGVITVDGTRKNKLIKHKGKKYFS